MTGERPAEEFRGRLLERIVRAPGVESFRFAPPEGFSFLPGQFCRVILDPENPRNRDLNKHLSFSSSPTREYVEVTKKLSDSEFSRRLQGLAPGEEVLLRGPMGTCIYREEMERIAFLAGGIGITPVISIVEYIVEKGLPTSVDLFYSNRTEKEVAFHGELERWSGNNPRIGYHCFLTREESGQGRCRSGRIDGEALLSRLGSPGGRTFFVFGPPGMVKAMAGLCRQIEVEPDRLNTESFAGY